MGQRNDELAVLINQAGISRAALARRVNDLGRACGLNLTYDYTAIHRWVVRGEHPKPPVPSLIAEVLTERLGRRVTPADCGMTDEDALVSRGLRYQRTVRETVDTVVELGRADVKRRGIVTAPFVLAALAAPSRDWLLATLAITGDDRGARTVTMAQVADIRTMFALFQELDVMRGGGHARTALVEYLNSYVLPLLKHPHSEQVQRALYEAASEQTYLLGWMAYDDGRHGLAERYLIQALRLAQESGNAALGAHILAGLSDQAGHLGNPREALMLARTGQQGITARDSAACLARLQVLEARALGALDESRNAARAVAAAEVTFQQVQPDNEPEWAKFIDDAYVFGEAAHCFRDLNEPDQIDRFATVSATAAQHQHRARRGALSNAALAIGHLQRGDVDAAAAKALNVVDLASSVNSSRCRQAVNDLKARLLPYRALPHVQAFNERADAKFGG